MSTPTENIAAVGPRRTVEYAVFGGRMLAREFLDTKVDASTKNHFLALFRHLAHETELRFSPAMFCQERAEIHTFKGKQNKLRIRLPCFRIGNRWIITHGFIKPGKSKWPEEEFTLANKIMREVISREPKKLR